MMRVVGGFIACPFVVVGFMTRLSAPDARPASSRGRIRARPQGRSRLLPEEEADPSLLRGRGGRAQLPHGGGRAALAARQPLEPPAQVPVPLAQELHRGRQQHRADDGRVDPIPCWNTSTSTPYAAAT